MNNQLPMFFSSMAPQLPVAYARYELRNPKSHLPTIKHKYAENSIRYCLISQLNSEVTWASTVEIITWFSLRHTHDSKLQLKIKLLSHTRNIV